jgi:hypothetical protein
MQLFEKMNAKIPIFRGQVCGYVSISTTFLLPLEALKVYKFTVAWQLSKAYVHIISHDEGNDLMTTLQLLPKRSHARSLASMSSSAQPSRVSLGMRMKNTLNIKAQVEKPTAK